MNELQVLSNDINVITTEIKTYQRIGGEAIYEIGVRLIHVKNNDLTHGEFGKWLESIGMNDRISRKFMTVARELDEKRTTSSEMGLEALYQIASLPEEYRDKDHIIPSTGEIKKVDEMTVRELREIKKELKKAKEDKLALEEKLLEEQSKPPKVETKVIEKEIDNTDYDAITRLENELNKKKIKIDEVIRQKGLLEEKISLEKEDAEEYRKLKEEINKLHKQKEDVSRQIESAVSLSALYVDIEHFLNTKLAPIKYSRALTERRDSDVAMNNLKDIIHMVDEWSKEMKTYLPNNNIIDVEVIG